jgi:hypothetical protein
MTFREFLLATEDASSTDKGLLGYPIPSEVRKPSDGQPFKDKSGSVAGGRPRPNSGGAGGASVPVFMTKKMNKK